MNTIKTLEKSGHNLIGLSRSAKLNALNEEMVVALRGAVKSCESGPVILYSECERAFCAGGDVAAVVSRDPSVSPSFFGAEYETDLSLWNISDRLITLGHGIVMGGGLGLFSAGKVRVATETSLAAMPEVTIGFFPDVASHYFLRSYCGDQVALFMALTGARLNAREMIETGLATHFVETSAVSKILETPELILEMDQMSSEFKEQTHYKSLENRLSSFEKEIETFLGLQSVEAMNEWASGYLESHQKGWMAESLKTFTHGSDLSKYLSLKLFKRKLSANPKEAFELDLKIAHWLYRAPDFKEGVRALLVDKDKNPRWSALTSDYKNQIDELLK